MFSILICFALSIYEPLNLDDETFEWQLKNVPIAFVMANRPDISFCQESYPKFRAAAEVMKDRCPFVVIDQDATPKLRAKFGIFAYPSFFIFRYGRLTAEFTDAREAPNMLAYVERALGPDIITLESARDVHDFLEAYHTSVILAGEDLESEHLEVYKEVAKELRDILPFAIAKDADSIQQLGLEELPSLRLHRSQDRTIIDYPLAYTIIKESLRQWIIDNFTPRYRARDSVVFRDLSRDNRYTVLAFVDSSRKNSLDSMHSVMSSLVDTFHDNFTYIYSDIYDMGSIVLGLGFSGAKEPCYAICQLSTGEVTEKYLFPERRDPTPENVAKWVNNFMNGSIKMKIRSEPAVEKQSGSLMKLVGNQFRDVVRDKERDVITLLLVGDQAKRDKAMALMKEVADEFQRQRVTSVTFWYINLDLNDMPGMKRPEIEEPAIIIWPAGAEKQPMMIPTNIETIQLINAVLTQSQTKPKFKIPQKYNNDEGSLEL